MTNPTPPGQVPEALRCAEWLEHIASGRDVVDAQHLAATSAAELRRLHAQVEALSAAQAGAPLTDSYVQTVPDKCDRIVWRNHYYHLPIAQPSPSPAPAGIYVASRASVPERPARWRALRDAGWPIVSTWIDEAGPGQTDDLGELWGRITREVTSAQGVLLHVEPDDFPLKGALIEVGMALSLGKRVGVYAPGVELEERSMRPLGSWAAHPLVRIAPTLQGAREWVESAAPTPACQTCNDNGMIGGPSFYQPDEGGVPCPDCTPSPAPAQPGQEGEREAFEAEFPVPSGVRWDGTEYVVKDDYLNSYRCDRFVGQWVAWQARASLPLPAAGQEPVAYVDERAIAWLANARAQNASITTRLGKTKSFERPMALCAATLPAVAAGWVNLPGPLPEPGKPVLLDIGKKFPIRAMWAAKHTVEAADDDTDWGEYDDATETYYCPEGWYEWNEHEDTNWAVSATPRAWATLPPTSSADSRKGD